MFKKLSYLKNRVKIKGRDQRAAYSSIANVCAQSIQIATSLVSVPLTLTYLDKERFALWIAITTLIAFLYFADLGIGIGMQDRLTKSASSGDLESAKSAFQISLVFSAAASTVVTVLTFVVIPYLPWLKFFDINNSVSIQEIVNCICTFVISTVIGIVSAILQRVFVAFQESYISAILSAASKIIGLIGLLIAVIFQGNLSILIVGMIGASNLFLLLASLYSLIKTKRWLFENFDKSLSFKNLEMLWEMIKTGMFGLGASIAFYIVSVSVPFVLTKKYGAESIITYSLVSRLTSITTTFLTQALSPLWPALTDAVVKNDWKWVKTRYRQAMMLVSLISAISIAILGIYGNSIIQLWTQKNVINVEFGILAPILFMMILSQWNIVLSVFLNGLSRFRSQATWGLVLSVAAILVALIVPSSSNYSTEIWIIGLGYFFRCAIMHLELKRKIY